ncbi:excalibur calcium-binding domain-containing protein [Exiguobacterium flavidum]|uniref:excalibur calcium-binding domain-containing protein n=1 Tax=Exiguobacterium flavidum TaxID=2184695 RepID=UPI000DF778B5|nr:excalibur calcium-binding domain-containing protein [Exiguobacterium flavidum]
MERSRTGSRSAAKRIYDNAMIVLVVTLGWLVFSGAPTYRDLIDRPTREQLEVAEERREELAGRVDRLKEKNRELTAEMIRAENKVESKTVDVQRLEQDVIDLETDLAREREQSDVLIERLAKREQELDELKDELALLAAYSSGYADAEEEIVPQEGTDDEVFEESEGDIHEEGAYYETCGDLKFDHPDGVDMTHPAYAPHLDRDDDGYACE